jgi:hypothetical protein
MYENEKMRPVETIPGMGVRVDKGEWWREWIQLWYIVKPFIKMSQIIPSTTTIKKENTEKKNFTMEL